ncbi:MAG: prepilin-type N-terminal cleavage/methylation domain-containing protein [Sedimentisphaerales bacterium]
MSIQINNQQSAIGNRQFARGFSLTEVILAVGILAVGMLFIAGVFPVSIYFTMVATERTIAVTVADEAFAKIKLYGIYDPNVIYNAQTYYEKAAPVPISDAEFAYPSTPTADPNSKRYWWSAICRKTDTNPLSRDVQVTVFVSRKVGTTTTYYGYDAGRPNAFYVPVTLSGSDLQVNVADKNKINDGYTIVDDATGQVYRVLERYGTNLDLLRLNETWQGGATGDVWVVPPPVNGGRYPCIGVYQKVMRF